MDFDTIIDRAVNLVAYVGRDEAVATFIAEGVDAETAYLIVAAAAVLIS